MIKHSIAVITDCIHNNQHSSRSCDCNPHICDKKDLSWPWLTLKILGIWLQASLFDDLWYIWSGLQCLLSKTTWQDSSGAPLLSWPSAIADLLSSLLHARSILLVLSSNELDGMLDCSEVSWQVSLNLLAWSSVMVVMVVIISTSIVLTRLDSSPAVSWSGNCLLSAAEWLCMSDVAMIGCCSRLLSCNSGQIRALGLQVAGINTLSGWKTSVAIVYEQSTPKGLSSLSTASSLRNVYKWISGASLPLEAHTDRVQEILIFLTRLTCQVRPISHLDALIWCNDALCY